ncbi:WD40 repeat domain-containing protein [Kaistella sp.]|uniref:WD40 repeat domain-containing protein n=1 Tax=Kaistella sp. TaxID=2782235 RepID=UPI003C621D8F
MTTKKINSKAFICILIFLSIQLWSQTSLKHIQTFDTKPETILTSPVFSNDGKFVIAGGANGSLNKFSPKSKLPIKQNKLDKGGINAVAITPDGKYILAGGFLGTLYLCDPETLEVLKSSDEFSSNINRITIAPNSTIAYVQTNGKCELINVADLSIIGDNGSYTKFNASFSDDSTLLYHLTSNRRISITDATNAKSKKFIDLTREVQDIIPSRDKNLIIAGVQEGYGESTIIHIIDVATGGIKKLVETSEYGDYAMPLCLVPEFDKVIYSCYDGLYTLDYKTFETKKIGSSDILSMRFSNDGKYVVTTALRSKSISLLAIQ